MRFLSDDISICNEILREKYTEAQVCRYSPERGRLVIVLENKNLEEPFNADISEVVFITLMSCEYISGYLRLENPRLNITQLISDDGHEIVTLVKDEYSRLEIRADGGFSICKGVYSDFPDLYENFFTIW